VKEGGGVCMNMSVPGLQGSQGTEDYQRTLTCTSRLRRARQGVYRYKIHQVLDTHYWEKADTEGYLEGHFTDQFSKLPSPLPLMPSQLGVHDIIDCLRSALYPRIWLNGLTSRLQAGTTN